MIKEKLIKYSCVLSAIISPILLIIYYFVFYIPMTDGVGSLLGYSKVFELLLVFILIFICSIPLSGMLIVIYDFRSDVIYPGEWMTVTLVKKHKKYFKSNGFRGGMGSSGYRYSFDVQDEDNNMHSVYGSSNEYECLIEGVKIQIKLKAHVMGFWITNVALIE